ncbi:MAG: hypothetical protein ABI652_04055 [Acidobacteriota bacterium]
MTVQQRCDRCLFWLALTVAIAVCAVCSMFALSVGWRVVGLWLISVACMLGTVLVSAVIWWSVQGIAIEDHVAAGDE